MLNEKQQIALNKLLYTTDNYFLTGNAGTGKTYVINEYIKQNKDKKTVLLSFTGIAATLIGGQTIHSFLNMKLAPIYNPKAALGLLKDIETTEKKINKIDTMIIDEVSMLRVDLFNTLNEMMKKLRHNDNFWGGIQLILVGDCLQLEPVAEKYDAVHRIRVQDTLIRYYNSLYFFAAPEVLSNVKKLELTEIVRQDNLEFKNVLNNIRVGKDLWDSLSIVNSRVQPFDEADDRALLCSLRKDAYDYNKLKNDSLPGQWYCLKANYGLELLNEKVKIKQDLVKDGVSPDKLEQETQRLFDMSLPIDEKLFFKVGSKVMTTVNSQQDGYMNGSIGIIKEIKDDKVYVQLKDNLVEVEKKTFQIPRNELDGDNLVTNYYDYEQYPLKSAWAITIHKSQGQTFEKVHIKMSKGAFANGQTYVALSRCKTLEGITLEYPLKIDDIKIDPQVLQFYQN